MTSVQNRSRIHSAPAASPTVQTKDVQTEKQTAPSAGAYIEDEMTISPKARAAMAKQTAASTEAASSVAEELPDAGSDSAGFASFAEEFNRVTEMYSGQIQDYYAKEHEENLTYADPRVHVWDKYKNPESPFFRADLSEDERAWAYDHELDLLNGGKHLQMTNPYAFPDGAPELAGAAMQANQACREQISQALQDILTKNEIELPEDASFTLTVDETCTIHVTGLEDEELTAKLEDALNCGENGKNLYGHLKLNTPDGEPLSVGYADGRLDTVDPELEWDDMGLREVKMQAGPAWTQYSSVYNPHQGPLSGKILTLDPNPQFTQEQFDRMCSAVRMGARQAIAEYNATHPQGSLGEIYNPSEAEPPVSETPSACAETPNETAAVNSVSETGEEDETTFADHWDVRASLYEKQRAMVEAYYSKQHAENMRFSDPYQHIVDKYINYKSPYFRSDLTEQERAFCKEQEESLLHGWRLKIGCYLDVALREDGDFRTFARDFQAMDETRSQISQSIDGLLQENGITLPEGASFQLNVNPYDYSIHVEGLSETLARAIEAALNIGRNGERLYDHIEWSNPAYFDGPHYSQYFNADLRKRSLYLTVERLTGYDIRTLDRHDGTFWTTDGKDLWSVLMKADSDSYYRLGEHAGIYRQLAKDGWDSTPDAYRSLVYQNGTLTDPDVLKGAPSESEWQGKIMDNGTGAWEAYLAGREETLRKEAADRAAGITSTWHFGPRLSNEFTMEELEARSPSSSGTTVNRWLFAF